MQTSKKKPNHPRLKFDLNQWLNVFLLLFAV